MVLMLLHTLNACVASVVRIVSCVLVSVVMLVDVTMVFACPGCRWLCCGLRWSGWWCCAVLCYATCTYDVVCCVMVLLWLVELLVFTVLVISVIFWLYWLL